ncbi:MAG: AraC family transcriptional regulator [Spirochaetaceae bacterium]
MISNILLLLLGGGFFIGTLISVQLFNKKGSINGENKFLGFIIFLCTINLVHPHLNLIVGNSFSWKSFGLSEPIQYVLMPAIYIYIKNHLSGEFKLKKLDLLHFIPALLIILYLTTLFPRYISGDKMVQFSSVSLWIILIIQSFIYMHFSKNIITVTSLKLEEDFSCFDGFDLKWNKVVLNISYILCISYLVLLVVLLHFEALVFIKTILSLFFVIIIWYIGFNALKRKDKIILPVKSKVRQISNIESKELKKILEDSMINDKKFLNPNLTLNDLTKTLGYSRNEISWVLNNLLNKNFYNFINHYRVEHVISLMNKQEYNNSNLLDIALDSGFNSKPTFNAVFKKLTGKTPFEYKKFLNTGT